MTSMNEHMNACSWYQSEKQRENPNLACQRQTNTKQGKRDLESIKMGQTKACDIRETKKQKQKNLNQGMSIRAHTQTCVRRPIVCVCILQAYVCMQKYAHVDMP